MNATVRGGALGVVTERVATHVLIVDTGYPAGDSSAELFEIKTGTWSIVPRPSVLRIGQNVITRLNDGRVISASGASTADPANTPNAVEIFSLSDRSWKFTAPITIQPRTSHTATVLLDGTVLVAGGQEVRRAKFLDTSAVFDPTSEVWTWTGPMPQHFYNARAHLLRSGRVLVVGGREDPSKAAIYDPPSRTWAEIDGPGYLGDGRCGVQLDNGDVLEIGGRDPANNSVEVFSESSMEWKSVPPLHRTRFYAQACSLPGNGALVVGGTIHSRPDEGHTAEIRNVYGNWQVSSSPPHGFSGNSATRLPNGKVLVTGTNKACYLYDHASDSWHRTGDTNFARKQCTAALVGSARPDLVVGRQG